MDRLVRTLAVAAIAFAVAGPVLASAGLTVDLNHSRRVMLSGAAVNVVVADPKIADVSIIDSHSIVLLGRGYGSTDVLVTDRAGHVLLDSEVVVPMSGLVTLQSGPLTSDYSCSPRCSAIGVPVGAAPVSGSPSFSSQSSSITISATRNSEYGPHP